MKRMAWTVLAVCAAAWIRTAVAQEPEDQPGGPGGMPMAEARGRLPEGLIGRLLSRAEAGKQLGLSEEQVAALKEKAFALEQERIKLKAELDLAALDQAQLLTEGTVKEEALMAAVEKTGKLRTEMAKLHVKELLLVKNGLTPEQRTKLRRLTAQRMKERRSGGPAARAGDERDRREWQEFQQWRTKHRRARDERKPGLPPEGAPGERGPEGEAE